MPEQKEGLKFLWDSFCNGKGCILAHEMGLGKTRTAISLILTCLEQSKESRRKSIPSLKRCIVLAPKNAVPVWEFEIKKWCPASIVVKSETIRSERKENKDNWKVINDFIKPGSACNILILSYDSFKKYNSGYDEGFKKYGKGTVDLVICDEAHALKNVMTKRTQSLQEFKEAGKVWIGITGTPYQNNLQEFCDLISFFRSKVFSTIKYKEDFCIPITNYPRP